MTNFTSYFMLENLFDPHAILLSCQSQCLRHITQLKWLLTALKTIIFTVQRDLHRAANLYRTIRLYWMFILVETEHRVHTVQGFVVCRKTGFWTDLDMTPPGKKAAVSQQQQLFKKPWECWHCEGDILPGEIRQKAKLLLTFREIGQEINIYILGAFGWIVFFVEGEFFLEAEGCRKTKECQLLLKQGWAVGNWICLWAESVSICKNQSQFDPKVIQINKKKNDWFEWWSRNESITQLALDEATKPSN